MLDIDLQKLSKPVFILEFWGGVRSYRKQRSSVGVRTILGIATLRRKVVHTDWEVQQDNRSGHGGGMNRKCHVVERGDELSYWELTALKKRPRSNSAAYWKSVRVSGMTAK